MNRFFLFSLFLSLLFSCNNPPETNSQITNNQIPNSPFLTVLGIAQDGGFPHAQCEKDCCREVWDQLDQRKMVSCLALVDPESGKSWMFDATPDFKDQWHILEHDLNTELSGIFLTHAHIGHYTGLMHLGREVASTDRMPVYAMPRMKEYLETNGPWSQLVQLNNIDIRELRHDSAVVLNEKFEVVSLKVPHRDEYSETVGFVIRGAKKSALFIPDINKWDLWEKSIAEEVKKVDYAFLDGTFYQNGEIQGRDMSEIPHPFIEESIRLFEDLPEVEKAKIHFIHFNHTNPVLQPGSPARSEIRSAGMKVAFEGLTVDL